MPHDEDEKRHDQCEANTKTESKRTLAHRTPTHRLDCIEQQMPAVQHWNGKKIDKSQADRQPGDQIDQGNDPFLGDLADHLTDSDWSAEIVGAAPADAQLSGGRA